MTSYVEVWGPRGRELHALDSERLTVGTLESNDVVVDADGVSRVHAAFERFAEYGYDIRRVWLDGTAEDRAILTLSHPDVVEHSSRTTAYEEQVCDA